MTHQEVQRLIGQIDQIGEAVDTLCECFRWLGRPELSDSVAASDVRLACLGHRMAENKIDLFLFQESPEAAFIRAVSP